jgi:3-dehydroquinate synthase
MAQPMALSVQKFSVPFDYPVYFTEDVFAPDNLHLIEAIARKEPSRRHRTCVIVERAVADAWPRLLDDIGGYVRHHRSRLALAAEPWVVGGGEAAKNDASLIERMQLRLHELGLDRQSFVVIVGGGALLDAAGYAAATVHRGLRVVRLPTTVLGQADSGVGVKNGINAYGIKNFFGTFAPPFAVLNDARFLDTLPPRDKIAGMAEAVKVALIRDAEFFAWLGERAPALAACEGAPLARLIRRCAELHLMHIGSAGDPFEMGSARPLDFGHWAAHKLESLTSNRLRHGEAVAIGIALDTLYSADVGLLPPPVVEPILRLLERLGFGLWDDALDYGAVDSTRPPVLDGLKEFREHLGGELTITLLKNIGEGVEVHDIEEDRMIRALIELRRRHDAA